MLSTSQQIVNPKNFQIFKHEKILFCIEVKLRFIASCFIRFKVPLEGPFILTLFDVFKFDCKVRSLNFPLKLGRFASGCRIYFYSIHIILFNSYFGLFIFLTSGVANIVNIIIIIIIFTFIHNIKRFFLSHIYILLHK